MGCGKRERNDDEENKLWELKGKKGGQKHGRKEKEKMWERRTEI